MTWKHSEGTNSPSLVEHICGNRVYIRRDVQQEQRSIGETSVIVYTYDECLLTEQEYFEYLNAQQVSKIDYVAMMTDVELEPTSNDDSDTSEQTE